MSDESASPATKEPSFFGSLKKKMIGGSESQTLLATAASNVALGFAVPFLLQAGMGSTLESAAIRAALLGLTNGVASTVAYGVAVSFAPSPAAALAAYSGATAVTTPVINTAVYGIGQQLIGVRSQGGMKDFTFAFVSSSAVAGGTMAALVGVRLLMELKDSLKK
jgi:hypothetical protein